MTGFWSTHSAYSVSNVILFQVDLAGHSAWVARSPTDLETVQARGDFATRLQHALSFTRFDRLNWLGDGGLFVRQCNNYEDAESVCAAAEATFRVFNAWRQPEWNVQLRVSATLAESVYTHPTEPGYWCSTRLNAFLKFERDIGLRNTFVITDELRRRFNPTSQCYRLFTHSRLINLGATDQITVWLDDRFPYEVQPDPLRFLEWLQAQLSRLPFSRWRTKDKVDLPLSLWFGESLLLSASLESTGYNFIELTLTQPPGIASVLDNQDQVEWEALRQRNKSDRVVGTKLGIVRFRGELHDDPIVRIQYRLTPYEDIKAFETLFEEDPVKRNNYLRLLLGVLRDGTSLPTTLSNHVVMLVGQPPQEQYIIASHRRKGRRPGGFSDNCWSISFEEQFNPVKYTTRGKEVLADRSVPESVLRGFREEFAGRNYSGPTHVNVQAFAIESAVLNFFALSILEIPSATVGDILKWWSTPGIAADAEEHDSLTAIPFERGALLECLAADSLPERFRPTAVPGSNLDDGDHGWHPTTPLRLALATWYVERQN